MWTREAKILPCIFNEWEGRKGGGLMCGDGDGDGFGCEDSEGDGNQVIMRAGMKIRRGFEEECVCVCVGGKAGQGCGDRGW